MMRGVASTLEKHHRVQLLDEALEAAVRLSHRYIPARQLPDKAVSLLDTACARVAISQHAVPPQLEDCRRTIEALQTELEIIGREEAVGVDAAERAAARARRSSRPQRRGAASSSSAGRTSSKLVDRILEIRAQAARRGRGKVEGTEAAKQAAAPDAAAPRSRRGRKPRRSR